MAEALPGIPGFSIERVLGVGATSTVYRAVRGDRAYALKLIKFEDSKNTQSDMQRFLREAATVAKLNHSGLVKLHEVGEVGDRPYLVMELVEGESLKEKLARGPLAEAEVLKLAVAIAPILDYFHCRGVVHKDLKPENILFNAQGEVKIIDFGFATEANEARAGGEDSADAIGTILYAAPEQTGMLKRVVDSRSDLYAFGGVLYHCLTGRPVFDAQTALALMTQHLSGKPVSPTLVQSAIRPVVSAIVLKLLAKDPDDRYQSARGLLWDLQNVAVIESGGEPYTLGGRDSGIRVSEMPLVGRAEELSQILNIRDQIRKGTGSVLLIAGEGGSGKTRLVRELLNSQNSEGFFVMSGKAKQGELIPFGPVREAIDNLLSRLQRAPEVERKRVLSGLKEAAGDLASIVRRLSPGLQKLLADAKEIPPLDGNAEQERFYLKVAEFFTALPKNFGPMILLIDDVQWLDEGSVEIFRQMARLLPSSQFLLATTARNDPKSKEALAHFLNVVKEGKPTEITLKPLQMDAIADLVAAHLGGKRLETSSLESIATKASGNPFAIGEYIRALLDRGMLIPTEDKWIFDSKHFRELALPDDVIQLLINRMANLAPETTQALSMAAVIGYEFEIDLLANALGSGPEVINRALGEGLSSTLIEKTERGYSFVHDRVSEALIQGIPSGETQRIHQRLAETLDKMGTSAPQHIYALARHYFLGYPDKNIKRVYETSLSAGTHALENFSNEEALELLRRALEYSKTLTVATFEWCKTHESIGIACTRTGRHQEAVASLNTALSKTTYPFDQARLHHLLGLARASEGRHDLAKIELFRALEFLGAPFAKTTVGSVFSLLSHWLGAEFRIRTRIGYGSAAGDERRRRQLISKINSTMNLVSYLLGDELLMVQCILRELHNVQMLGTCIETAKAHCYYGVLGSFLTLRKMADHHGKLAIDMAYQLGDQETIAYCELNYAISVEFYGDVVRSRQMVLEAWPKVRRYSAAWEKSVAIGHRTHWLLSGVARENLAWLNETMPVLEQTGDLGMVYLIYSSYFASHSFLGNVQEALRALELQKKMPEHVGSSRLSMTSHNVDMVRGLHAQEDFGPDLEKAIETLLKVGIDSYHTRDRFAVMGFARADQYRRAKTDEEKKRYLTSLKHLVGKAGFPNAMTPLHLAMAHALKGVWFALNGKNKKAEENFAKAEKMALETDNYWILFLIARERARMAALRGDETHEEVEARRALKLAAHHGWMPALKQVSREFGVSLLEEQKAPSLEQSLTSTKRGNFGRLLTAERNAEVLLQINLASASSLDPKLQSRAILDELVNVLGAERAFLFEDDPLRPGELLLRAGRDAEKNDINELKGYSSTVVKKVGLERKPLILSGTDEGELLGAESVVAHNLRSILAVPVMFREKFMGILYLDSTLAKGIFTEGDLEIVQALASHIAISLETVRSANIELEHNTMRKDLEVTTAVQSLILPKKNIVSLEQLKMASFYKAANQSGGDWWWYDHDRKKNVFSVLMGDVTGHGAGPAMISAAVSAVYQSFKSMRQASHRVPDFLKLLNTTLFELAAEKYLISMNAFEIDLTKGTIDYWSAGAPPMFIIHPNGECNCVFGMGKWLGTEDFGIGHESYQLEPGDRVALFTDGLFEIETTGNKQFGLRRLERLLKQTRAETVEKASNSVIAKIIESRIPSEREDDISFVLVDFLGPAPASQAS